ncbi:MAG: arylesterase [Leptospiraceae bacterium]|nr:arylesterase [Leptospiraceae bacterium]MCP5510645.1 arylesterase [Leptospiraceae bacterium]
MVKHFIKVLIFLLISSIAFCEKSNPTSKESPIPEANIPKHEIIVFLGDSLTAGMGLSTQEESYVHILESTFNQKDRKFKFINAGVSGDTTSGGLNRLDWILSSGADYLVIELGANDMMRGISPAVIQNNLKEIIQKSRIKFPNIKILLIPMKPFPNLGKKYGKLFEEVYSIVSREENVPLSEFLLKDVAGIPELNQKDGIHPTAEGHKILAKNIEEDIRKLLEK